MARIRIQDTDTPGVQRYVVVPEELPPLERSQWSAANKPALQPHAETNPNIKVPPPVKMGLSASDIGLGDWVMANVERVPYGDRRAQHHYLTDHGVHGKYGRVVGSRIEGGIHYFEIEHATGRVWVPSECIDLADQAPQQAQQQHEPRLSPERMRKSRRGAYNMT